MNLLGDIKTGDEIEYIQNTDRKNPKTSKGIVTQVTGKLISLQGKNYPDTILVNDLISGQAKILKLTIKGEDTMARYDWDTLWPQVQELQAKGKTIVAIADEIGINIHALKSKIWRERQKEEQQTQPPEPEELGGTDPVQEEKESAENSIPYSVERLENIGREINPDDDTKIYTPERQNYTITQYNEQIKQGGFTAADEEPIPYTVVDGQLSPLALAGNQILVMAWEKIDAVVKDPIALPLLKELIKQGVA